jgi:hypothetical protein
MAGFCELAISLQAPELGSPEAKSPIVSGGYLKYSRFRETGTGDRVRYALHGRSYSANSSNSQALLLGNWEFGARAGRRGRRFKFEY